MNAKQLSEHIGNIDDRLVQRSEQSVKIKRGTQTQNKGGDTMRHKNWLKNLVAIAAAIALMVCGFCVGAFAFAREQETIQIEEIGLTLILPDSWKGKYALEQDDNFKEYHIYNPAIREAMGGDSETFSSGGTLFYIKLWDEQLTKAQVDAGGEWSYANCQYIMTTQNGTYLLYHSGDVQFTPETETEYRQMEAEINEICFLVEHAFPPKDITVRPEGMTEEIEHTAQVQEPEKDTPGFAIYVDTERYDMAEEKEKYYIRPIGAEENAELICEMEIEEMADVSWEEAARTIRDQLREEQEAGRWDFISDISQDTEIERLRFSVSEGTDWNSAREEHYFYQMNGQGTYHIILRYFLEAAEGHGARFHAMLDTFTPVSARDT